MKKIITLGAGLVGTSLSIYLAQKGFNITVIEKRPKHNGGVNSRKRSINLALSVRGLKALKRINLAEQAIEIAVPMYGRCIHHLNGQMYFQAYGSESQSIYSISREGLNQLLVEELQKQPNINLLNDYTCTEVNLEKTEIRAINTANKAIKMKADVIFGTDGVSSIIRDYLPTLPGFSYNKSVIDYGYKELSIKAEKAIDAGIHPNALHIWPRKDFLMIALPNPDGSFTCTLFLTMTGENSFDKIKNQDEIISFFEKYFSDTISLMPSLIEDFISNPTSRLFTLECYPWCYKDKLALMGDAAHAIIPFYGQGLNAGLEDFEYFSELFESQDLDQADFGKIFQEYQQIRKPNTDAIARLSQKNFVEMREKTANKDFLLGKQIEQLLSTKYPQIWTPLYSMVSFSNIPYEKAEKIGKIQEGIMGKILSVPQIHQNWQNLNYEKYITEFDLSRQEIH